MTVHHFHVVDFGPTATALIAALVVLAPVALLAACRLFGRGSGPRP